MATEHHREAALAEIARRSRVMAEAQRFSPWGRTRREEAAAPEGDGVTDLEPVTFT